MKTLYKIRCEYDLGLGDYVYESEELATNAAREVWESEEDESLEELEESGLFYVTEVYLIAASSEE